MSMYIGIVRSVRTSGRMRTRIGRSRAIVRRELRKMRPMRGHARRGVTSLAEEVLHGEPEASVVMRRNALREIARRCRSRTRFRYSMALGGLKMALSLS